MKEVNKIHRVLDAVKCYVGGGGKENRHVEEEGCNFKYDHQEMFH